MFKQIFNLIKGKPKVDYKPTPEHYARAIKVFARKHNLKSNDDFYQAFADHVLLKQYLHLLIKYMVSNERGYSDSKYINDRFYLMECILQLTGYLTPREFITMFPITKDYDGDRYECKDYYYTMNSISEFGLDRAIGDDALGFLFDYWNREINELMVHFMGIIGRMNILNGGEDIALKLMEDAGVQPLRLYEYNGEMINSDTGDRYKIVKSRDSERKHLNVIEGGD